MARKKQPKRENTPKMQGFIAGAGEIQAQDINDTLRQNYMPYAMSVIMSRAIPEIDGFKPSHRKLLYTMYKMNLLGSARTKSANIVGQTMKLNPHGDSAIYDLRLLTTEMVIYGPMPIMSGCNFCKKRRSEIRFSVV